MGLFDRLRGSDEQVVFLGIDGVPYDLVSENPDVFPNLTAIGESGSAGSMESIVPPESSACWPSLTTGTNPGKTGVYGFQDRDVGSYDTYVPMGRDVQSERIWDTVTQDGGDATVMNVPVTFPPSTSIQRQVSGFLSPSVEDAASDDELRRTLEEFDYRIDTNAKLGHKDDKSEFVENAHETLDARHRAFQHYIEEDDWDLFFGVFMTPDRVNHFLFRDYLEDGEYAEEFFEFYRTLDDYIGQIRDALDDDTTLIVASDHGFTGLDYEVNCNQWLADEGWLEYDTDDHESLEDIGDARAYSLIPGRFYINLEGREPGGVVAEEDYEEVREELIDDLESFTAPDGRDVCRRIVKGEEVFSGEWTDIAPDLVVIPTDGFDLKSGFKEKEAVFADGPRNGMHKFDNSVLYTSNDDVEFDDVNLYDVAPTILELLDVEYDEGELDGQSLVV
ncbi:alkaline phosphatase family protein [Haloparvum sp. AD34]